MIGEITNSAITLDTTGVVSMLFALCVVSFMCGWFIFFGNSLVLLGIKSFNATKNKVLCAICGICCIIGGIPTSVFSVGFIALCATASFMALSVPLAISIILGIFVAVVLFIITTYVVHIMMRSPKIKSSNS